MNALVGLLNVVGAWFVGFGLPMLLQSSLLIALLLGLDLLWRRRVRAVVRYGLLMLILVKLVLPVGLSAPTGVGYWLGGALEWSRQTTLDPPAPATLSAQEMPAADSPLKAAPGDVSKGPAAAPSSALPAPRFEAPPVALTWKAGLFVGWCVTVIALGLLLVQRVRFVRGLVAQSAKANAGLMAMLCECRTSLGLRAPVQLRLSPNAASPALCGLVHPVILIPQDLPGRMNGDGLRAVLLHELVHVQRRDLWVNGVQTVLQIAYFYNPLLWLANWIIRRVREQAVDEAVLVAMGERAREYPEVLLSVARLSFSRPALSLRLTGVAESRSAVAGRIRHMINRPLPKSARLGAIGLGAIILVAAALLPMAARAHAAAASSQPAETATAPTANVAPPKTADTKAPDVAPPPAPKAAPGKTPKRDKGDVLAARLATEEAAVMVTETAASPAAGHRPPSHSLDETHSRLSEKISVEFNMAPLPAVFDELSRLTDVQFAPDWAGLNLDSDMSRQRLKITLKVAGVSAYKVLDMVLKAVPPSSGWWGYDMQGGLAFAIDRDGLVKVSMRHGYRNTGPGILRVPLMTGLYDVADLLKKDADGNLDLKDVRAVTIAMYPIRDAVRAASGDRMDAGGEACDIVGTALRITAPAKAHNAVISVLTERRGQAIEDPSDVAVRQRLALTVDAVDLYGVSLEDALGFLQKECDLNLDIRWQMLRKAAVDETRPLTLERLQNVTLDRLINAILANAKPESAPFRAFVENGCVVITVDQPKELPPAKVLK
jgi:beta-lactamase regulating signal transducer with metallopeptidase domain